MNMDARTIEHLSQQDAGYLQKVASGRMKLFGWSGWFWLLAPAALAVVAGVGLLTWIHHRLPEGTRLVICLWDGKSTSHLSIYSSTWLISAFSPAIC